MAYVNQDDYLQDPLQQNQQGQQQGQQQVSTSGSSSGDVGSGQASTAGIGPGGTGGWTNIQAYLNANQNNAGSASALNKTVGSQFDKEESDLNSAKNKFVGDAVGQVESNRISDDQAKDYVNQAANQYSYSGQQSDDYRNTQDKFRKSLTGSYSDPGTFSYGFSNPTQNYGSALAQTDSFRGLMGDIYNRSSGGQMSRGQLDLQSQLDTNNDALEQARNNLYSRYSGLSGLRDNAAKDAQQSVSGLKEKYDSNQAQLKKYLDSMNDDYGNRISNLEGGAKSVYQNDYGNQNLIQGPQQSQIRGADNFKDQFTAADLQAFLNNPQYMNSDWSNAFRDKNEWVPQAQSALQNFYQSNDDKYRGTASNEKRRWNVLQDFLNTGAKKRDENFNVRG